MGKKLQFNHLLLSLWQISDAIYNRIKLVHTEYAGRAISTEFALFTTAIVCVLGGSAFLASSLTVEADRKVHKKELVQARSFPAVFEQWLERSSLCSAPCSFVRT